MTRSLFVRYEGVFEGMRHGARLGSVVVRDDRWQIRCWGSGVVIGGSVRRAEIAVRQRSFQRAEIEIESHDGRFHGTVTALARPERLMRSFTTARGVASKQDERRALVSGGQWWLDPVAFLELGPASSASVTDTRYLGGWSGDVRFEDHPRGRILDLDASGITLRGFRRHLHIPWNEVRGIAVDGHDGTAPPTTIRIQTGEGEVRFESRQSPPEELRKRLAPLTRRIERTSAGRDH
jgi:hypothetical protein